MALHSTICRRGVLLLLLLPALTLGARDQKVRDVDISLTLIRNGDVVVRERWDVDTGDQITEWYLVRENLGDIEIKWLSVYDGNSGELEDDGEWDVNRSRAEKAGKFGIVHKPDGAELCWGVGEYGDHVYHVIYAMTRAVKSLQDYDMLHLQVVSPGLSSPPQHVRVRVEGNRFPLDTANTRIWGFGFEGHCAFQPDSTVVFESDKPLGTDDSVIILLRFDKGLMDSPSVQDRPFQEALDIAMEGADFGKDEKEDDPIATGIAFFFTCLIMWFAFLRPFFRMFKNISGPPVVQLGFRPKDAPWWRDIPMNGDLRMADYILTRTNQSPSTGALPLACILRLIHNGCLRVNREAEGPAILSFTGKHLDKVDPSCRLLYHMLESASGEDKLLQDKEFSRWAIRNALQISDWEHQNRTEALDGLSRAGWFNASKSVLTPEGKEEAKRMFGLKSFLSKFTLLDQREAVEANLWKEYMVYGALFGITDRVAKQLKDIDPALFKETFHYDFEDLDAVLSAGTALSRAISLASYGGHSSSSGSGGSGSSSRSSRGYGGSTSRSGGRGYSGGGRGGGGR